MKNIVNFNILSLLLACCFVSVSCENDNTKTIAKAIIDKDADGNYIFNALLDEENTTRTIRQDDGSVYWEQNESIKIFYDSQTYGTFTSTNESVSATASFSGQFNNLISDSEIISNGIVALYPSQDAEYNNGNIIFTVSPQQEAEVGTFKKGLFPAIAKAKSSSLSFYNVCGGIKLSVYYEGIKSITLKGNNSEYLAGRISTSLSASGIPEYTVIDGISEITLVAPQDGYFEVGKMYYIIALPGTLLNGFTITYHTDSDDAIVKINNTVTIHRSKFGLVLDKDVHGFVIDFDDPSFKASIVDEYDDNFDGEIDYLEAENVTNINCSNRNIYSLGGIEHFTNLKSLNCSRNFLQEINLSSLSKLTTLHCFDNPIESLILDGCISLTAMTIIDATINSISQKAVNINGYNNSDKFNFSAIGAGFTDFSFINSSTIETLVIAGDYSKSLKIYDVPNVAELNVSKMNVEVMDLHNLNLSSLDLTQNTNLKELYLQNNKLTSINLTKNTQLTKLNLSDNKLQSVNLRQNTLLTDLLLNNNISITNLNIDNNLLLTTLEAEGLSISAIDLSQHSSLKEVKLRNNPQLRSMVIWDAATKKNDYLFFDMANVMVTDANGTSYGYPYTVGQYIPWFNGGVIYSVEDNGGGKIVNLRNLGFYYYYGPNNNKFEQRYEFYVQVIADDPWIPGIFNNNSETDGEQNMKDVYDYYGHYDKFAGFYPCAELSKDGKWYLPAIKELEELYINASMGKVPTTLYNKKGDYLDSTYHSSTFVGVGDIVGVCCAKYRYNEYDNCLEISTYKIYSKFEYNPVCPSSIRAIRKF